jgi:hypothetical protein
MHALISGQRVQIFFYPSTIENKVGFRCISFTTLIPILFPDETSYY